MKNQYYYQVLTDVKDYQLTFPDYVQSVSLTQNNFGNFADLSVSGKGIGYDLQMEYSSDPASNTFSGVVTKGAYSGSTITITTSKTWSFNGKDPEGATKIHAELKLKNSGLFSALSFVSDDSIKFGLQQALDKIGDKAKAIQQQNIGTTQLVSTSPTQTTSTQTTTSNTSPTTSTTRTTPPVATNIPVPKAIPTPTPILPQPTPPVAQPIPQISSGYYPIKNGLTFAVGYTIKGATLSSMNLIPQTYSLNVFINSQSDGSIDVTIPSGLLDAKIPPPPNTQIAKDDLKDTSFIIVITGKQVMPISDTKISGARILSIPFHYGDSEITIVGTWVL